MGLLPPTEKDNQEFDLYCSSNTSPFSVLGVEQFDSGQIVEYSDPSFQDFLDKRIEFAASRKLKIIPTPAQHINQSSLGSCFTKDTKVLANRGLIMTIGALLAYGGKFTCVSFSKRKGAVCHKSAYIYDSDVKDCARLHTNKGVFTLSIDHPMMLTSGEFCEMQNLKKGDTLYADEYIRGDARPYMDDVGRNIHVVNSMEPVGKFQTYHVGVEDEEPDVIPPKDTGNASLAEKVDGAIQEGAKRALDKLGMQANSRYKRVKNYRKIQNGDGTYDILIEAEEVEISPSCDENGEESTTVDPGAVVVEVVQDGQPVFGDVPVGTACCGEVVNKQTENTREVATNNASTDTMLNAMLAVANLSTMPLITSAMMSHQEPVQEEYDMIPPKVTFGDDK